jgi:hypothetical protein
MNETTNDEPTWPEVAAARRAVTQRENDLADARKQLLAAAVAALMSDPGAYAQASRVAAEAGFSDTYLSRALTPEQRATVRKARAARVNGPAD